MAREFIAPGNIFTGAGALDMAEDKLSQLGKKALIVTDNVMVEPVSYTHLTLPTILRV